MKGWFRSGWFGERSLLPLTNLKWKLYNENSFAPFVISEKMFARKNLFVNNFLIIICLYIYCSKRNFIFNNLYVKVIQRKLKGVGGFKGGGGI